MNIKCPRCVKAPPLRYRRLEGRPQSYCCPSCEGQFLSSTHYIDWQQRLGERLPEKSAGEGAFNFDDSVRAMMCPGCRSIMLKYRAKNDLPFQLDFCRRCNGIWLDPNEWEALFARNLHDEINFMFTDGWQSKLNRERLEQRLTELFAKRVGPESYDRVTHFREWLKGHEHESEILAFLSDTLTE